MNILTVDDCLDLLERHFQYRDPASNRLVNFRTLTFFEGEVYIEYRLKKQQYNVWIDMNHPNLHKRVEVVMDISDAFYENVFEDEEQPTTQPEYNWGEPAGEEVW